MSELLGVISAVAALAMPFILLYLNGIQRSLHELRGQITPTITKQAVMEKELQLAPRVAVLEAEGRMVKHQLKLMEPG